MKKLEDYVVNIYDFPKPGIIFRDVTGITNSPEAFHMAIDGLSEMLKDVEYDVIVACEARGFFFGAPLAYNLNKQFIPARKKGKLPRETVSISYALEYGTADIEIHKDDIKPGQKVVIIDDLLATGGTVAACAELLESMGAEVVKCGFVIELAGLEGRKLLKKYDVAALITYEGK